MLINKTTECALMSGYINLSPTKKKLCHKSERYGQLNIWLNKLDQMS